MRSIVIAAFALFSVAPTHLLAADSKRAEAKVSATDIDAAAGEIGRAIDEERLVDARKILDAIAQRGIADPKFDLLSGELELARGRPKQALNNFEVALKSQQTRAGALQGKGIALSQIGRSDDAIATLKEAVAVNDKAWRAWNVLGAEYDERKDFVSAAQAYERAVTQSNGDPAVLNNRGYSSLMQGRIDDAAADFVAALRKQPDLAQARTNLRLTIALRGDYDRATAAALNEDKAALLNNAGFAAVLRGDYAMAQNLFDQAIKEHGQFYARASENLSVARGLASKPNPSALQGGGNGNP
ncbi:MAG: tetratricopeptide repeat protein [Caulobacterales bacterium]